MHPTEADACFMLPCAEKTAAPGWGGPCSAICFLEVRMAQVKEQNPAPAQNRASDNSGEKRPRTRRPYYSRRPRRPQQPRLGTAYITGFKWALEHRYDYIFEMDADFSHNPRDLVRLYEACVQGADLSIGSRYVTGVNVVNWPMSRVLLSFFASKYVKIITGMKVHDATAGFVCYTRKVLETINLDKIRFKGYAFQIEMKFTASTLKFRLQEVPIIFTDRTLGTSKMSKGIIKEAVFGVITMKMRALFGKIKPRKD